MLEKQRVINEKKIGVYMSNNRTLRFCIELFYFIKITIAICAAGFFIFTAVMNSNILFLIGAVVGFFVLAIGITFWRSLMIAFSDLVANSFSIKKMLKQSQISSDDSSDME